MEAPFRTESPRARSAQQGRAVFSFVGFAAIIGWLYVFFMSDLFVLQRVETIGAKVIDPVDVSREVWAALDARKEWRPWSPRHQWFINEQALAQELQSRFFAEEVAVDTSALNILRLKIRERTNKLIFHSHKQYVWVDLQGVVLGELTKDELTQAQARLLGQRLAFSDEPPIVHSDLDELMTVGFHVAEADDVKNWIKTSAVFVNQDIRFREYEPPMNASSTFGVFVNEQGIKVLFDLSHALEPQLKSYKVFLAAKRTEPITEYIDIRIPGRVYVK